MGSGGGNASRAHVGDALDANRAFGHYGSSSCAGRRLEFRRERVPNNQWIALRPVRAICHMTLILKHANKNRLGAIDWGPNDFDVCVSDRSIGRIFLAPQSSPDRSWMWTITARDYPRTIHSRGYSATREQAMQEFKAQWLTRVA